MLSHRIMLTKLVQFRRHKELTAKILDTNG